MDSSEISLHLKKTLVLLKHQMEKAKITGTYVISADTITYQKNLQTYPVPIDNIKRKNDANRLYHKLPEFFNDLCSITHNLLDIDVPSEQNWEEK
ncbi:26137_t:CDS:1, partial [Gigaspora margarita]